MLSLLPLEIHTHVLLRDQHAAFVAKRLRDCTDAFPVQEMHVDNHMRCQCIGPHQFLKLRREYRRCKIGRVDIVMLQLPAVLAPVGERRILREHIRYPDATLGKHRLQRI